MSARSLEINVSKVTGAAEQTLADLVAVEEPLEIRLGYSTPDGRTASSISITMRTPGHDADLATGFLFTESIIKRSQDVESVQPCGPPAPDSGNHNIVRVELAPDVEIDLGRLQRHFYTTSSCGVCGKSSLDALHIIGVERRPDGGTRFARDMLVGLPDKLRDAQKTFAETGGLHAAAAFDSLGELVVTREDVGRHNAVDKVIGVLLAKDLLPADDLGLIVSGRTSFELMQKTLMAGMPLLAAVSAPSSLAVQLAREFNVSLVGVLRGDTFNIYSGEERIA